MTAASHRETLGFQSEVRRLLDLMIHSLYGNSEVFLRELVSNAADALDKLRYEALADEALYEGDPALGMEIDWSPDLGTVTVRDSGIGMTRQEVIDNLGTIARSGTREFVRRMNEGDAPDKTAFIGQFGVGFYSAFIVADRVTVITRRAGADPDAAVRWESDGQGEFTVEDTRKKDRGTEIVLHLRAEAREYLDGHRLRAIVHKYSDHIAWPIAMRREGDGEPAGGTETVNAATALWTRPRAELSDDDYRGFFRHISHDPGEPLAWAHNRVEGAQEYTSLLYIPADPPFDLWDPTVRRGVKLYVRRVYVMDAAGELLPRWLRFVRGVIDSADLPLNVSREILQQNRAIDAIRGACVKRVLGLLEDLAKDRPADYERFWRGFGRALKEGVVEDRSNGTRIAGLLRFSSTREEGSGTLVSLADYVARMRKGQKDIYYLVGEGLDAARASPHLELFRARGVEVLLLGEPIDEWVVGHLHEYEGKRLRSVAHGEIAPEDIGGDAPAETAADGAADAAEALARRMQAALGGLVSAVRTSRRLTSSPACIVAGEHDLGAGLQRALRAAGHELPEQLPALEINAGHPLVQRLVDADDPSLTQWSRLLLEQARLAEGGRLDDPAAFVRRLNDILIALAGDGGNAAPGP